MVEWPTVIKTTNQSVGLSKRQTGLSTSSDLYQSNPNDGPESPAVSLLHAGNVQPRIKLAHSPESPAVSLLHAGNVQPQIKLAHSPESPTQTLDNARAVRQ